METYFRSITNHAHGLDFGGLAIRRLLFAIVVCDRGDSPTKCETGARAVSPIPYKLSFPLVHINTLSNTGLPHSLFCCSGFPVAFVHLLVATCTLLLPSLYVFHRFRDWTEPTLAEALRCFGLHSLELACTLHRNGMTSVLESE